MVDDLSTDPNEPTWKRLLARRHETPQPSDRWTAERLRTVVEIRSVKELTAIWGHDEGKRLNALLAEIGVTAAKTRTEGQQRDIKPNVVLEGPGDRVLLAERALAEVKRTLRSGDAATMTRDILLSTSLYKAHAALVQEGKTMNDRIEQREQQTRRMGSPAPRGTIRLPSGDVTAKTESQARMMDVMDGHGVSFAIGPAGTGKTFLAVANALKMLQSGEVERIILARPAVEAGGSLGYLPGTKEEKIAPYLRPLLDEAARLIGPKALAELRATGQIEVAPLAFLRGRTLDRAAIVVDEAQNATPGQMKMVLTRLGAGSRMTVTGDMLQSDLPEGQPSGLAVAARLLADDRRFGFLVFDDKDVVRHPAVQEVVTSFESHLKSNDRDIGAFAAWLRLEAAMRKVPEEYVDNSLDILSRPGQPGANADHGFGVVQVGKGSGFALRNANQQAFWDMTHDRPITIAAGPAGCGKTFLAALRAAEMLKNNEVKKIVLCRPAVEAGEKLGFLPGDQKEKILPYMQPLVDELEKVMGREQVQRRIETGSIVLEPLELIRGATLYDSCCILDEAQNCSEAQIKMFLTRLGQGSKMIVTGDPAQSDLDPKVEPGIAVAMRKLGGGKYTGVAPLTAGDIVRHPLVSHVLKAFESDDGRALSERFTFTEPKLAARPAPAAAPGVQSRRRTVGAGAPKVV